jgi:hypothetical protein
MFPVEARGSGDPDPLGKVFLFSCYCRYPARVSA